MSWGFHLLGRAGRQAEISDIGEVLTRRFDYSDPQFQFMDTAATAYSFFGPRAGEQLVITDIIISADRNVTTQTLIDIYEADAADELTIVKSILRLDVLKSSQLPLIGLNLLVSQGVFVNAKHDDDDVFMTIAGYYIPVVG